MFKPLMSSILLDHIRGLGFHTGRVIYYDGNWQTFAVCLDAVDSQTRNTYTVRASITEEYEAVCKLAEAVGIDLMDG